MRPRKASVASSSEICTFLTFQGSGCFFVRASCSYRLHVPEELRIWAQGDDLTLSSPHNCGALPSLRGCMGLFPRSPWSGSQTPAFSMYVRPGNSHGTRAKRAMVDSKKLGTGSRMICACWSSPSFGVMFGGRPCSNFLAQLLL